MGCNSLEDLGLGFGGGWNGMGEMCGIEMAWKFGIVVV